MTAPLRRLARGLVAVLLLLGAGCDLVIVVLALLFIGPLYPGLPQAPPPPPDCPITVPSGEAPPPVIPGDLDTGLVVDCAVPARPALARQNRDELERSLQALTGVEAGLKDTLPPDATGAGLDVIAELLTVSPLLVERLEASAFDVVGRALRLPGDAPTTTTIEAETTVTGRDEAGLGLVTLTEWDHTLWKTHRTHETRHARSVGLVGPALDEPRIEPVLAPPLGEEIKRGRILARGSPSAHALLQRVQLLDPR